MDKQIEEFNEYLENLISGNIDRYGIPFSTERYKYFYDTGTGKVLQCGEEIYRLLCHLFENQGKVMIEQIGLNEKEFQLAAVELKQAVEEEHIFRAKKFDTFVCAHTCGLEEKVGKVCKQLILEVTERCNLRCRYCIYGDETENFRSFNTRNMTFDIAKKAMDYALSIADDDMSLSFYGGEPLIQYKLIQDCTEYFKSHFHGDKLAFALTSNLTLLTEEMAEFFHDNQFIITCSLDGDRENHNINRPYCNGSGSFDDTLRGLKMLAEVYGADAKERLAINAVIDLPYTVDKFEAMNAFFRSLTWLPKDISISISYAGRDESSETIQLSPNMDLLRQKIKLSDVYGKWVLDKMRKDEADGIPDGMVKDALLDIHKRVLSDKPIPDWVLNGCCVPGTRRLFVTVDGRFSVCEKIGYSPDIGNVEEGINLEKVKKYYVDDYIDKSIENCSNCWAVQLCSVCYARCYDKNGLDMKRKKMLCESNRFTLYNALIRYHTLLEEHPEILEAYNEIEVK